MDASRNGQRQFKFVTAQALSAEGPLRYGSSLRTTGTTRNIFVRQRRDKALVEVSFQPGCTTHAPASFDCAFDLQVKTHHVSHAQRLSSTSAFGRENLNH
jgi:hypothetical protein